MDPHCNTYSEEVPVVDVVRIVEEEGQVLTYDDSGSEHGSTSNIATGNGTVYNLRAQNCETLTVGPVTNFHGHVTINVASHEGIGIGPKPVKEKNLYDRKAQQDRSLLLRTQNILSSHRQKLVIGLLLAAILIVTTAAVAYQLTQSNEKISIPSHESEVSEPHTDNLETNKDIRIIRRHEWGARPPKSVEKMPKTPSLVIIKHTAGSTCQSTESCISKLQSLQAYIVGLGAADIWYNFVIGGDGNVYEGRGWDVQSGHNDTSIGICFIGNYVFDELTPRMIEATLSLLKRGVELKKLTPDYKVVNHNQTYATLSPGRNVVKEVKKWPHYYGGLLLD